MEGWVVVVGESIDVVGEKIREMILVGLVEVVMEVDEGVEMVVCVEVFNLY